MAKTPFWHVLLFLCLFFPGLGPVVSAQTPQVPEKNDPYGDLTPYQGISVTENRVANETLTGKIMCGYQGWFTAEGDGSGGGWTHYGIQGKFEPGFAAVDLWPDMSEMDDDEKYPTPFRLADGSVATVFSSQNPKTVRRHFQWMRDYGLDGVFLQRFPSFERAKRLNNVLVDVRRSANETGRCWALMYDLSGQREGTLKSVVMEDWKRLSDTMKLGKDENDKSYLRHDGKPVVAVWGIGFNDNRRYTLKECMDLITFLREDPVYGGFCVMIGVPTYWRDLKIDTVDDPFLHEIIRKADIVSPWAVDRYHSPEKALEHVTTVTKPDIAWCRENKVEYLPVVFPGFSWKNLMKGRNNEAWKTATEEQKRHSREVKYNPGIQHPIPRLKGAFLETQYRGVIDAGAVMVYQAMFDEIDEATAIFKCANDVPTGASEFVTYEGLPSDFYLKMVGRWTKTLREKTSVEE
ncbi:MAG TPA: xylosidase/arabinosidase [Planctomycetaceae bacterium]|nr:xylosidase/arabinosidase [Planctomycetaceae bacterium]